MAERVYYGGQAVIEGVMMRGRQAMVTAVRRPDGEVALETRDLPKIATARIRRIPVIRGVAVMIESLLLGIRALMYSANVAIEDDEEEGEEKQPSINIGWGLMVGPMIGIVALFFLVPLFLANLVGAGISSSIVFHLIEGFIRLGIFVIYLKAISLSPDIRRVFAYHGAEHMVVNAYEAGVPLNVAAVKRHSTAHVRCGTSFLFVVLLIAIVVFAVIGRPSLQVMIASRVLLIPLIAGLGYEANFFGARHTGSRVVRAFLAPGLWLQSLTTRPPDDRQIEVALASMKRVLEVDANMAPA